MESSLPIPGRLMIGFSLGLVVFLAGFWLQFHTEEFGHAYALLPDGTSVAVYARPDGNPVAPYAEPLHQLADLLMYAGTALGVLTACAWVFGPRPHPAPLAFP